MIQKNTFCFELVALDKNIAQVINRANLQKHVISLMICTIFLDQGH